MAFENLYLEMIPKKTKITIEYKKSRHSWFPIYPFLIKSLMMLMINV